MPASIPSNFESSPEKKQLSRNMKFVLAAALSFPPTALLGLVRAGEINNEEIQMCRDVSRMKSEAARPEVAGILAGREHMAWPLVADYSHDGFGTVAIESITAGASRWALVNRLTSGRPGAGLELVTLRRDIFVGDEEFISVGRVRAREVPLGVDGEREMSTRASESQMNDIETVQLMKRATGSTPDEARYAVVQRLIQEIDHRNSETVVQDAAPFLPNVSLFRQRKTSHEGNSARYDNQFIGDGESVTFVNADAVSYLRDPRIEIREGSDEPGRPYTATLSVQWTHDSGARFAGPNDR